MAGEGPPECGRRSCSSCQLCGGRVWGRGQRGAQGQSCVAWGPTVEEGRAVCPQARRRHPLFFRPPSRVPQVCGSGGQTVDACVTHHPVLLSAVLLGAQGSSGGDRARQGRAWPPGPGSAQSGGAEATGSAAERPGGGGGHGARQSRRGRKRSVSRPRSPRGAEDRRFGHKGEMGGKGIPRWRPRGQPRGPQTRTVPPPAPAAPDGLAAGAARLPGRSRTPTPTSGSGTDSITPRPTKVTFPVDGVSSEAFILN